MEKARIVKVGTIDDEGFPKGWVFDLQGQGAVITIPETGAISISPQVSVIYKPDGYSVDVYYMPPVDVFYGGYSVDELREIESMAFLFEDDS